MELELHPAAEAEARDAWLRYRAGDPAVADRFMVALDRAIEHIAAAISHQHRRPGYWWRRKSRP